MIKYNFSNFTPIDINTQLVSTFCLNNFFKHLHNFDLNHCLLLPEYNDKKDIQYSGITGSGKIGDIPIEVAQREIYEETGLDVELNNIILQKEYEYRKSTHFYYFVDINNCKIATKKNNRYTTSTTNKKRSKKWFKINVYIYGSYDDIYSTIEGMKYLPDNTDDIENLIIMQVRYIKKIHRYAIKFLKENNQKTNDKNPFHMKNVTNLINNSCRSNYY